MRYIPDSLLEKRLPPFSGLVLVALLFVTITWLTSNVVLFGTKAAAGAVPKKMQLTNISDTSFTVSYQTDEPVLGSVGYGKDNSLGSVGLDDRDALANKTAAHRIHYITIKNLTPGTKYVFEIASGGTTYKNSDIPYQVITAGQLSNPPEQKMLAGKVTLDDGSIPTEGIVSVSTDTSQNVSALLKPDGSYEVPLSALRAKDLASWLPVTPTTHLTVTISDPTKDSQAILLGSQLSVAPLMVLSKNYDFTLDSKLAEDSVATGSAQSPVQLPIPVNTIQVTSPIITVPKEAQSFTDTQPQFEGKALPSTNVELIIKPPGDTSATIQSDTNGNWTYQPQTPLSIGKHTLTLKSPDSQGTMQTVKQSFTVLAEGGKFIEPSISPVLLPSPVLVPSFAPEPTMTLAPSPVVTSTPTPQIPTPTLSGSITPTGSSSPPVPKSGSSAWIVGLTGIILSAGIGAYLFFFI